MRQGTDEQGFRDSIRRLLSADRYADRVVEQRVKVTDADIEAFYKLNAQLFDKPEQWKVRTIAIAAPAAQGADARRGARVRAESLRQELAKAATSTSSRASTPTIRRDSGAANSIRRRWPACPNGCGLRWRN